jgi:hypothetical protein
MSASAHPYGGQAIGLYQESRSLRDSAISLIGDLPRASTAY